MHGHRMLKLVGKKGQLREILPDHSRNSLMKAECRAGELKGTTLTRCPDIHRVRTSDLLKVESRAEERIKPLRGTLNLH